MAGFMQPQGHVQVLIALHDDDLDPQSALDLPRFCITSGEAGGRVALEMGIPLKVAARLAEMGHEIIPENKRWRAEFGRGQVILRDREDGVLCAGSDPRADGCAMTY
jgi:gamma-glutamyltranspeptidase/glutathione hydrolase